MKPARLAIIGAGHLGRIHAKLAKTTGEFELVGIVDPVASAREGVAAEADTRAFASHVELRGEIDAAVIATPTKYHYEVALDMLSEGVHVFVEKPITLCAADADDLIDAAAQSSCVLQVGHVERFNPAFLAGKFAVEKPRLIQANRSGTYTFRSTDVSVVLDLMIHDIDLVLSIAQAPLRTVHAVGGKVFGPNEDWAQAHLTFANDIVANLYASRVAESPERTMSIVGDHERVSLDFQTKKARCVRSGERLRFGGVNVNRLSATQRDEVKLRMADEYLLAHDLPVIENNAIVEELRDFAAAIRRERSVVVPGEAGRDAVAIAERILMEIAGGQKLTYRPSILPFLPKPSRRAA